MARRDWHMTEIEGGVALSRTGRGRLDVLAETVLPAARPGRVAHQVRQDVWRALRRVRGFSPVVHVQRLGGELRVVAGGQVSGRVPPDASARIAAVLADRGNRARWVAHAGRGEPRAAPERHS
ncbi:hypothetical protein [Roseisalinus antarcticus]|uniref:Uncharacterized protein n=1 Tax=Roseisalinus antarcticus TaxID=254357 RepID=A0A1Y5SV60_9RHOB|nr:hypothetical protein [Roseisalinus antarcticus]SLN47261.1 hypothetical protein ROA7023_01975 [Roseisalinus antarcticus]